MKCDYCEIIEGHEPAEIIHQDDSVVAFVSFNGVTNGQLTVLPKEHFTILEMIPNKVLTHMLDAANKLSASLFDALGVQGTNILIQNGLGAGQSIPHCAVQVIPRKENDGLKLDWKPQELSDFDLEDSMIQISSNIKDVNPMEEKLPPEEVEGNDNPDAPKKDKKEIQNYLIKSTRRRP